MDGKGYNYLHSAIKAGDLESVLFLIGAHMDVNILTQDAASLSPVHLAATAGHEMILRNLVAPFATRVLILQMIPPI